MLSRRYLLASGGLTVAAVAAYFALARPRPAAVGGASDGGSIAASSVSAVTRRNPVPVVAQPLTYHIQDGEVLTYQLAMHSHSDVDVTLLLKTSGASPNSSAASAGQRQKVEISSGGTLAFKFFAAPTGGWKVGARLSELKYLIGDQASPESRAMEQPFSFALKPDGTVGEFAFTPGVSPKAQAAMRQLLSWFQAVVSNEPRATWSTHEVDATGSFRARYQLIETTESEVIVSKSKTQYVSLAAGQAPQTKDTHAELVSSTIQFRLSRSGSWLNAVSMEEKLSLSAHGREWGTVDTTGSIKRLDGAVTAMWPTSFEAFEERVQSTAYLSSKSYETDPKLDGVWSELSTSEAVARFSGMLPGKRKLAEKLMINYLRQKPTRSGELVRLLDASTKRDTGVDETTRLTLWRLNATAGHKEAQKAQLDAALDRSFSRTTRMNALAHLEFTNPEPFVVDQLLELRRSTVNAASPTERELGSMALLSLGALGDASHPNLSMSARIERELEDYLASAKEPSDVTMALQAIGNSGNPAAIDAVTPYFDDNDRSVRVNALESFRRMNHPQAASVVMQHFEQNTNRETRAAALRSLSGMAATPQTMAWGRAALTSTMETENLAQLAAWLGSQSESFPENSVALRQLLHTDPPFEVKKSILKFISP